MIRELTDTDGTRFRVGDEVTHCAEDPGSAPPGTVRRLYDEGDERSAVVAWPHWRPLLRRLRIPFRNRHALSDLRPE